MNLSEVLASLSEAEILKLEDAIPYITVLISGADGDFDVEEFNWASKLTHIRSYKHTGKNGKPSPMNEYYDSVAEKFEFRFMELLSKLPQDVNERSSKISVELAELNPILKKIDPFYAHLFYTNFISFAHHVAKAEGGFLGIGSINAEEKKWVNLPMLEVIHEPEA